MMQEFLDNLFENRKPPLYSVASVPAGFRYWFLKLLNCMLSMLEYGNVPEGMTSRDLELCFLLQGYATPFKAEEGIVSVPTSIYGYNAKGTPTKAVYGNPLIPSKRLYFEGDKKNSVLMYNIQLHNNLFFTEVDGSFRPMLCRYARRLADIESTENIYTVKLRMGSAPVAGDDAVNASIKSWIRKIIIGNLDDTIADDAVLNSFRSVDVGLGAGNKETLMSIQAARDKILEQFFRELGVKTSNAKKAQITEEESSADEQLLLMSPSIILQERQKGLEEFNSFFNTNMTVRLNPLFNRENFIEGSGENGRKSSEEI